MRRSQGYGLSILNATWCTHYTAGPGKHWDAYILREGSSGHLMRTKHAYIQLVYVGYPYTMYILFGRRFGLRPLYCSGPTHILISNICALKNSGWCEDEVV